MSKNNVRGAVGRVVGKDGGRCHQIDSRLMVLEATTTDQILLRLNLLFLDADTRPPLPGGGAANMLSAEGRGAWGMA